MHKLSDKLYIGLTGFHSDAHTVLEKILIQKNLYELREGRLLKPKVSIFKKKKFTSISKYLFTF